VNHPDPQHYRFEVALSFAGDGKRPQVCAVAEVLRRELGEGKVFFDEWFEEELAGHDAHIVLQNIYRKETRLVVTCVCQRYNEKPWTQEEWRAIQAFERTLRDAGGENRKRMRFLPLRFGDGEVDAIFETAIVPDVRSRTPEQIAALILKRWSKTHGESSIGVRVAPTEGDVPVAEAVEARQLGPSAGPAAGARSQSEAPDPVVPLTGEVVSWQHLTFRVPPGWSCTPQESSVVLGAPLVGSEECFLAAFPLGHREPDAFLQASKALNYFAPSLGFQGFAEDVVHPPRRGTSANGWPYVTVQGPLKRSGVYSTGKYARAMLIAAGNQASVVIGVEADGNMALGLTHVSRSVGWELFFYSLSLQGSTPLTDDETRRSILGRWWISTHGISGDGATFAPNGRYADDADASRAPSSFVGDGRFVVSGNRLTTFPDRGASPKTAYFRAEELKNGPHWLGRLQRLDLGFDGQPRHSDITRMSS
jgi:TIR domain